MIGDKITRFFMKGPVMAFATGLFVGGLSNCIILFALGVPITIPIIVTAVAAVMLIWGSLGIIQHYDTD